MNQDSQLFLVLLYETELDGGATKFDHLITYLSKSNEYCVHNHSFVLPEFLLQYRNN